MWVKEKNLSAVRFLSLGEVARGNSGPLKNGRYSLLAAGFSWMRYIAVNPITANGVFGA